MLLLIIHSLEAYFVHELLHEIFFFYIIYYELPIFPARVLLRTRTGVRARWVAAASDTVAVGQCNWRNPRFESGPPNFLLSLSRSHRHSLPTPLFPTTVMPTCRRKRVVLTEPSEALLQLVKTNPNKEVYFMQQTGEIFESYEYDCLSMSNKSAILTRRVPP